MNKQRLAILIIAVVGALSTFMPWVKAPFVGTVNGTQGDGWITLALFLAPIIISLLNDKTKALKGGLLYGAIIPSIIAGAIGLWKIIDFKSKMSEIADIPFARALTESVSIEFGLYVLAIAGLGLPIVALLIKDKDTTSE